MPRKRTGPTMIKPECLILKFKRVPDAAKFHWHTVKDTTTVAIKKEWEVALAEAVKGGRELNKGFLPTVKIGTVSTDKVSNNTGRPIVDLWLEIETPSGTFDLANHKYITMQAKHAIVSAKIGSVMKATDTLEKEALKNIAAAGTNVPQLAAAGKELKKQRKALDLVLTGCAAVGERATKINEAMHAVNDLRKEIELQKGDVVAAFDKYFEPAFKLVTASASVATGAADADLLLKGFDICTATAQGVVDQLNRK